MTKTAIIQKARDILGNKENNSLEELFIPLEAIEPAINSLVRRLNRLYGSSDARKEVLFQTTVDQQDYLVSTTIGEDVLRIDSVTRSSASLYGLVSSGAYADGEWFNVSPSTVIPQGMQGAVLDEILAQERARRVSQFHWETPNIGGAKYLRLMPTPMEVEYVEVIYISTGAAIGDLPDETENALINGTAVAILDAMLNRLNGQKISTSGASMVPGGAPITDERRKSLKEQRDRYIQLYDEEMAVLVRV